MWLNNIPLYLCTTSSLFLHPSVAGCFRVLALLSDVAVDVGVQAAFWDSDFISFECRPRSGIAEAYGSSVYFLRSHRTLFHCDCTNLQAYQQCKMDACSLHPHQHFSSLVLLPIAILTGVRWYLAVVLISIFPDDESDIEQLIMYPSAIFPLWEKVPRQFFCRFLIRIISCWNFCVYTYCSWTVMDRKW